MDGIEGVCLELILGLFETEGFSRVGSLLPQNRESWESGLLVLLVSLGLNLFTPSGDRRQEEGVTYL